MKKLLLTLSVLACAVALVSTPALAQDKPVKEKKACGCCKDLDAQKKCKEDCCKKASEKGKICKKCTAPGQAKKEEKK